MATPEERWALMRELFDRARTVPTAERDAYLDRVCDDADLRQEIAGLLQAHDSLESGRGDFLGVIDEERAAALLDPDALGGAVLGRYRLIREIGRGGMGVVHLAYDPLLDRQVALKVLRIRRSEDANANSALAQEARAASATDHPNIATVHDVGQTPDGRWFIVMSHYAGVTLGKLLGRGALPPARAAEIARQVAAGLVAAHEAGLVHRDIKPANILITPENVVKILDFGIARLATRRRGGPGAARRNRRVHESRADRRRHGRWPRRCLGAGRRPVGDARRGAAVRGGGCRRRHQVRP